ncbi:MAG: hypothetical protein IAE81_23380, partial [Caldilineaceae bacterium]|nr:hypothetical protein [Caldilineaceae bacterium]
MAQSREPRAVRRLDMSKYAVLLVLAVAAIILLTTRSCQPQLTLLAPTPAATQAPVFTAEALLARPVLVSPLTGSTVAPGEITLSGEGVRGYSIRVRDESGRLLAAASVAADGVWTTTATIDQPGDAVLSLELVNLAGDVVAAAERLTLTIGMPSMAIRSPSLDKSFLDATLTAGLLALSGGGEPGSIIQVVVDGAVATSTEVDQNGRWAVDLRVNAPGVYAIALQSVDASGTIVATATPSVLSVAAPVRAVEPVPPTVTATPELLPPAVVDSIIVTTDANSSRVAADGKGNAGVEVQLLLDDTVVATTTIGATGSWSLVIALEQPDAYAVGVRAFEPESGAEYDLAAPPRGVVVAIPDPAPSLVPTDIPLSEETLPPAPQSPLPTATMMMPPQVASTEIAPTEAATPTAAPPSVDATAVDSVEQAGAVPLSGSGGPGDVVRIMIDGRAVGTTVVDAQGRWRMLVELADSGVYSMTVETISIAGQVRATSAPILLDIPPSTSTAMPAPTGTPVPTDTATTRPTATNTATATPVPTDTLVPTDTATTTRPTATNTATATSVPTDTPVPTDTATTRPTATDTTTATPVPTDTSVPTDTATTRPTATNTATATSIPTDTPVPTDTATARPTATDTATA